MIGSLTGGGGLSSSSSSSAKSSTNAGQSVGGINMGSPQGINPWLIGAVILAVAFLMLRKK